MQLPAVRVNVLGRGSSDPNVAASGTAYRMGEQVPNRVPYTNSINISGDVPEEYAPEVLRHELGHILEPSFLRNKGRGESFTDIVGLTPRANVSNWGLARQGSGGGISPLEFYAQVVAGQLGNPTYNDLIRAGWSNSQINARPMSPAISIAPARQKLLEQMGLIPKKVKK